MNARSFEINKIAGAGLMALLVTTFIGVAGNLLVHPKKLEKNVYVVEGVPAAGGGATATASAPAPVEPIAPLLAAASADAGKTLTRQCSSCHTFDKGGKHGVGPNLWDTVGHKPSGTEGYAFSPAMKDKDPEWSYENLNQFLANPRGFVPGTKMAFAGVKKPEDRANVIAYLRSLADTPKPLP